jgi:hypothetical protein
VNSFCVEDEARESASGVSMNACTPNFRVILTIGA